VFSHQQRLFNLALAFTLSCEAGFAVPAWAAATSGEIVAGIDKEHILAPGARVNARVDGSTVYLSTFRNNKANDTDLKIDAMLMSKVVMTLDPSVSNVTVYFFSSSDLTTYKQTSVNTVAVKAFGSGAVGKDELIASLTLTPGTTQDVSAKLANAIAAGQGTIGIGHRVESAITGTEVNISTDLDPDASERDVKYAALQLAEEALKAAPELKTVKIAFADLSQPGSYRQVELDSASVRALNTAVKNALATVSVSAHAGAATATGASEQAIAGPMQDERQKLLNRIATLGKNGVGISPFLVAFKAIEQQVASNASADAISDSISRLSANVDVQEKNYKDAKARKTASGSSAGGGGPTGEPIMPTKTKLDRWAPGIEALQTGLILEHSEAYAAEIETKLKSKAMPQKMKDQNYARTLQFFVQTLKEAQGKSSELAAIKRKLYSFERAHPELSYD
jgi:hypothetical protein